MGYELYREVKVHAPLSLTHREKLTAMVLADDANDRTRLTYSSVVDPEILRQAMVKNDRDMRKILARLQDEKVIEKAAGGHNGSRAKYRFLHLAPAVGSSKPGELKGVQIEPATPPEGGPNRTGYEEAMCQKEPPTGGVGGSFWHRRGSKKNPPTPPTSSTTSSSSNPPHPSTGSTPQPEGGGGGSDHDEQQQHAAVEYLRSLPAPWSAGRRTAANLAPLLLAAAADTGWQLDEQLATKLTENAGGITNYAAVLRKRIEDLPRLHQPRASVGPTLPPWCGQCDGPDLSDRWRSTATGEIKCPDCNPHARAA
ncbi:hypothetical protein [Streptomyces sp. ME19-01-6]|uniref:hypothetical protein n=1 Tax=Streptomyces sp. ME19-01-6 TaxID=3028686 RepID=UPI0029A58BC1|nr:hypothetical protein [Streptomyces sp. ME19-01-6]MDX3229404.1 hypothetical protein [Streptomyces sp. ME19-01-6]